MRTKKVDKFHITARNQYHWTKEVGNRLFLKLLLIFFFGCAYLFLESW